MSFQYNANQFNNKVRRQALGLLSCRATTQSGTLLLKAEKELNATQKEFNALDNSLNGSAGQDRLIALKELLWLKSRDTAGRSSGAGAMPNLAGWNPTLDYGVARPGRGAAAADSGKSGTRLPDSTELRRYDSLQRRLDSLGGRLDSLDKQYQRLRGLSQKNGGDAQNEIAGITSGKVLKDKLDAEHVSDSSLPKGYPDFIFGQVLWHRANVAELLRSSPRKMSASMGCQIEYNPSAYMAVAAGTVDYRFRDYSVQPSGSGAMAGAAALWVGEEERQ